MVVLQALAGAAAAELAPELKDWSKDGIAFFNNIRTPAALLAASALKDAFVLQGKELPPSTLARTKRLWVFVREAYLMLMVVSFGLNLWTVFLSTAGAFHLQAGAFDPLASSMVALLQALAICSPYPLNASPNSSSKRNSAANSASSGGVPAGGLLAPPGCERLS